LRVGICSILARAGAVTTIVPLLSACAVSTRPAEPPSRSPHRVPDGAIALRQNELPSDVSLGQTLSHALDHRFTGDLEPDASGRPVFRLLALSGGGSRGAYGAAGCSASSTAASPRT
jgi:hypothetical protein